VAGLHYRALVAEHAPCAAVREALAPFAAAGRLLAHGDAAAPEDLLRRLAPLVAPTVAAAPAARALRVRHVRKAGCDVFLLFNEERAPLTLRVGLPMPGPRLRFDPAAAQLAPLAPDAPLAFAGHELQVILVPPAADAAPARPAGARSRPRASAATGRPRTSTRACGGRGSP
jgi:hypothetical protein